MSRWISAILSLVVVLALLPRWSWAQGPLTRQAVELAQDQRFEEAEAIIERALNTAEAGDATAWYVHAFIEKSLFVVRDGRNPDSPSRLEATRSAMECARLDESGELEDKRVALLTFLSDTHLEDARDAIRTSRPGDGKRAHAHLEAHAAIQRVLDPSWNPEPDAVLLDQMLAEHAFAQAEEQERSGAGPWFEWGRTCYERAALRGPDRFRSLFNLAVHTYNQGVRQFKASENNLDAVDSALRDASVLWNLAATGLEQAIEADSDRAAGYEALAVVSEALLNRDRVEWCRTHLAELGGD